VSVARAADLAGLYFLSPGGRRHTLEGVYRDICRFMAEDPQASYKLIVGSDSQTHQELVFVTAVVIHRLGKGARYYYQRTYHRRMASLRQRILFETSLSLAVASELSRLFAERGPTEVDMEIHLDIGPEGDTRDLIRDIVGMVLGSGFDAKIKPDAYAASSVADRYTKNA
jgi:predicted RNase H-related nuclease YkuK (DUF458 family)